MHQPGSLVVYVAGPYRAPTREAVELNIQTAMNVGLRAAKLGWSPVIPHANTAHLDAAAPGVCDQFWLDATMALLRRCDAVVLCPGWRSSVGTLDEIGQAQAAGIPVYDSIDALPVWAEYAEALGRGEAPGMSARPPAPGCWMRVSSLSLGGPAVGGGCGC